jgi:hypothetical protein
MPQGGSEGEPFEIISTLTPTLSRLRERELLIEYKSPISPLPAGERIKVRGSHF